MRVITKQKYVCTNNCGRTRIIVDDYNKNGNIHPAIFPANAGGCACKEGARFVKEGQMKKYVSLKEAVND